MKMKVTPLWVGVFILAYAGAVPAQDLNTTFAESMVQGVTRSIDIEEPAGYAASRKPTPLVRDPWIEKLHQERKAGNITACRQMERQALQPQTTGEAACGTIVIPSTTIGGKGDLRHTLLGEPINLPKTAANPATFGKDVKVRPGNLDLDEYFMDMASDSQGNLYVVWEDTGLDEVYLQVYMSSDGGKSWSPFGYLINNDHNLERPSIAVGEDAGGGGTLLIAYTVRVGGGVDYPEVATSPLPPAGWNYTIHSVPIYSSWEQYWNPVIVTDSNKFKPWYAYLTCEGVYHEVSGNYNICAWRSTDGGDTWTDEYVAFGNNDDMFWCQPDLTFGTNQNRVMLATFNRSTDEIYTKSSDSFGASWNSDVLFYAFTNPLTKCMPQIAAAAHHDNVMICCNKYSDFHSSRVIGHGYSQDAGETWSTLFTMNGSSGFVESHPELTANEAGNSWHVIWTSMEEQSVFYNQRPQDLSATWGDFPLAVNDNCTASPNYYGIKKGIASIWDTDEACICWADIRDGAADNDCYCDRTGNHGLMTDRTGIIDEDGCSILFMIRSGAENADRNYAIFGSATGTSPGTPLPGGLATLPINWDIVTDIVLGNANVSFMFMNFIGKTDAEGRATAIFNLPPVPGFAGVELYFAYAHNKPCDYASNAITIRILEP